MKRITFTLTFALISLFLFSSCQKGEHFFYGTWQTLDYYTYFDEEKLEYIEDLYTLELTLNKKDAASLAVKFPQETKHYQNVAIEGTYTLLNDYTIAIKFDESQYKAIRELFVLDEVWVIRKLSSNQLQLFMYDYVFAKIKN